MTSTQILVPDIGDFDEVTVIEILVKVGDTVAMEQSLITVESDKASMEIPSSHAGKVTALQVKLGDKVKMGSPVVQMDVAQVQAPPEALAKPTLTSIVPTTTAVTPAPTPTPTTPVLQTPVAAAVASKPVAHDPSVIVADLGKLPNASPSVRKYARELGVSLQAIKGSAPNDRITMADVQAFTQAVMRGERPSPLGSGQEAMGAAGGNGLGLAFLPWPKVDFAKFGAVERKALSRIKRISGANLHRNWVMIPHVTNNDEADITELEALRVQLNREGEKTSGPKVTMLAFLIKACVHALQKFPDFNASLEGDGESLVYKHYYHIGFAADTPQGLLVPVIRDANQKGILDIAREMTVLSLKAREGKLSPAEMTGGTFSISSLGGIGGTHFTPIINAPELAILGVSKSELKPKWDGQAFVPRLMLPLSLSYDHRVIDGAAAARFNAHLVQVLRDFRRVSL